MKTTNYHRQEVAGPTGFELDGSNGNQTGTLPGEIARRKGTETARREDEERLRFHTDNSPLAVVEWNADLIITQWTGAAEKMFGWSAQEAVGKSITELPPIHEEDLPAVQSVLRQLTGGVSKHVVSSNRNRTRHGQVIHCEWYSSVLNDGEGKMMSVLSQILDVTERKRTEEALVRERLLLRTLIDNLPDGIYAKDAAGRKTLANPADLKNLRCKTEAEAIGKSDFDFFSKDIAEKFWADDQKVIAGQPVIDREEYFFDETGRKRWLLTSKLPLRDQQGTIIGLIGTGRDITQLKDAEEALARERLLLRTLIDNLPDGVYAKDITGRKTLANPADLKVMSCKTEAEAIGKNDFDLFPKDIAEKFWADDQKVIAGQPVINREEYYLDEAGQKRWLLTSKLPLRDQSGKIAGLVGIGRDITQQKEAEAALRKSEEKLRQSAVQLERSNRELQDFAYVASHDLQEPLRKVTVFSERLKETNADKFGPDSLGYLDRMQKATGRMQTLINDLLTFSRVTTKAQPFAPVNLAEVAAGVVEDLEGRIELVKGRVEVGPLPVIDAEPLQMRQLLQNLIGNALKFRRPEEPPVVKVEAQIVPDPQAPEKKLCRLTVSDNCIGFEEKYAERIFQVFQRLHTRNEYEGSGMGLAIVRKIALYHGGDVTARSKPGAGSTFILTIPVTHPQRAEDKSAAGEPPSTEGPVE